MDDNSPVVIAYMAAALSGFIAGVLMTLAFVI